MQITTGLVDLSRECPTEHDVALSITAHFDSLRRTLAAQRTEDSFRFRDLSAAEPTLTKAIWNFASSLTGNVPGAVAEMLPSDSQLPPHVAAPASRFSQPELRDDTVSGPLTIDSGLALLQPAPPAPALERSAGSVVFKSTAESSSSTGGASREVSERASLTSALGAAGTVMERATSGLSAASASTEHGSTGSAGGVSLAGSSASSITRTDAAAAQLASGRAGAEAEFEATLRDAESKRSALADTRFTRDRHHDVDNAGSQGQLTPGHVPRGGFSFRQQHVETHAEQRLAQAAGHSSNDHSHAATTPPPAANTGAYDPTTGLAEPTPECKLTLTTFLGKCVFPPSPTGTGDGGTSGTAMKGPSAPSEECTATLNTWLSKCVFVTDDKAAEKPARR